MIAQIGLDSLLIQLGVGGIFAVLVIRMVLDFLNRKNGGNTKGFDKRIVRLENNIDDIKDVVGKIHDMHNVKDSDGFPVWYVPRSWQQTQKEIMELNLKIVAILKDMMKTAERTEKEVSQVKDSINDIK